MLFRSLSCAIQGNWFHATIGYFGKYLLWLGMRGGGGRELWIDSEIMMFLGNYGFTIILRKWFKDHFQVEDEKRDSQLILFVTCKSRHLNWLCIELCNKIHYRIRNYDGDDKIVEFICVIKLLHLVFWKLRFLFHPISINFSLVLLFIKL